MMKRYLPFIIIGAVLLIAGLLAWMLVLSGRPSAEQTHTRSDSTPSTGSPGASPPHMRGDASAVVTIEEFGDFQCPPCGALHPELKKLEADFGSRLRVIFRERPLMQVHKHALLAARAAEAAGLQGRFWEMHDKLFESQKEWSALPDVRTVFAGYAGALGLDVDRFNRDIDGPAVETRIFLDGARAHALGVEGTPTVFLNNREVPFDVLKEPDGLRAAINTALSGKGP
jgi:protein-disulfide isomerase